MVKKVLLPVDDYLVEKMFEAKGWEVTHSYLEAHLVVFTGGEDVHPNLYDEGLHYTTKFSKQRDDIDQKAWEVAKLYHIPCLGICRGAQFIHVMNGGKLFQNTTKHTVQHSAYDKFTQKNYEVTSTHHQMMRNLPPKTDLIMYAEKMGSSKTHQAFSTTNFVTSTNVGIDYEMVGSKDKNLLCCQPHPEYMNEDEPFVARFWELLYEYCGV